MPLPAPHTVVVVAGGGPPDPAAAAGLPDDACVIAADSGLDHALGLGLRVDLVVGDMDSVSPAALAGAEAAGTAVERHPAAKDQTDLELALDHALALAPTGIVVLAEAGGRLDHLLGVASLLAHPRYAAASIRAHLGPARVTVLHGGRTATFDGRPGDLVSLVPVHGAARGVTTEDLLYPLADDDLPAGTTRGLSNELLAPTARVHLRAGTLLAIQPGP